MLKRKTNKYLPPKFEDSEIADIRDKLRSSPSFHEYVIRKKENSTEIIMKELFNILNGKIPRNFVISIKGGIGRQSGVFKSALGHQLALSLDPTFTFRERVGFTVNEINDKLKEFGKTKQIFVLDEKVRDLKRGALVRLANIIESCREVQVSFILIGIPDTEFVNPDYCFERLSESDDKSLPKKTIYYSVRKDFESRRFYRGFIKWNIVELEDNEWGEYWKEYMVGKRLHQEKALKQELTGFNFKKHAVDLMRLDAFEECILMNGKINKGKVKSMVYTKFPDITNNERKMIYDEVCFLYESITAEKEVEDNKVNDKNNEEDEDVECTRNTKE